MVRKKASETERGIRWLSNFCPNDQTTARLLLDAVEYVGEDEFWNGMREILEKFGRSAAAPITLVPVRELALGQSYFPANPNARPRILNPNSLPGSEGVVATLLETLRRLDENKGVFTAAPSLRNMRAARTKTIVLVDDFSGSGDRIIKFKYGFHCHPTLWSWKSRKLFNYGVAVYAATRKAAERLERRFGKGFVRVHRIAPNFGSRGWSSAQQRAVEDLCRRYKYQGLTTYPLGHGAARGLLAFAHTAPNNLPPILWQTNGPRTPGRPWQPFFQGKAVPADLADLFNRQGEGARASTALLRMTSPGDWKSLESTLPPLIWRKLLIVLLAVRGNPRTELRVAELTDLPLADVLWSLMQARRSGLVTTTGLHLTDNGRAELRHAREIVLPENEFLLKGSAEPYYPTSLRVGR